MTCYVRSLQNIFQSRSPPCGIAWQRRFIIALRRVRAHRSTSKHHVCRHSCPSPGWAVQMGSVARQHNPVAAEFIGNFHVNAIGTNDIDVAGCCLRRNAREFPANSGFSSASSSISSGQDKDCSAIGQEFQRLNVPFSPHIIYVGQPLQMIFKWKSVVASIVVSG